MKTTNFTCLALLSFALSPSVFASGPAEEIYNSLTTREEAVQMFAQNGPVAGVGIFQKFDDQEDGPTFCRKYTPVVPHPTSTYECFYKNLDGANAQEEYASSSAAEMGLLFHDVATGGILAGVHWSEKRINDDELCVETSPLVPSAHKAYVCYMTHGPAGGAVSGSN